METDRPADAHGDCIVRFGPARGKRSGDDGGSPPPLDGRETVRIRWRARPYAAAAAQTSPIRSPFPDHTVPVDMSPERWAWLKWLRRETSAIDVSGWSGSIALHLLLLALFSLFLIPPPPAAPEASLESRLAAIPEEEVVQKIELDPLPLETPESLDVPAPEAPPTSVKIRDVELEEPAPLSPLEMPALDDISEMLEGPNPAGMAALGAGSSFDSRGQGLKGVMLGSQGGTKQTENAVEAGLSWLARHQFPDGHWSLDHRPLCAGGPCSGPGVVKSDMAATAFGVLPFLAANHTHQSGEYEEHVARALTWMIRNQRPEGLLAAPGDGSVMYTHGLAAIAICEAYGLTGDPRLAGPAQAAVLFLAKCQNQTGGWRYSPESTDADTSVFGWQLMALKSGQMAGLDVPAATLEGCTKYLDSAAKGEAGGLFGYMPQSNPTPTMTAVGLLCRQFLGSRRDDADVVEGVEYLLGSPPTAKDRNCYLWYYATQVIHNYHGPDWDRWNRAMRKIWVKSQARDENRCDFGSWDPHEPVADAHGDPGGRLMITSIGLLTLEVYYRYLPLYQKPSVEAAGDERRR